jgi:hypothetical protein
VLEFIVIILGIFLISEFGAENIFEFLWGVAVIFSKFIVYTLSAIIIFALFF